jgi:hypothetical protein
MTNAVDIRTRLDSSGRSHAVESEPCEGCGCLFDYAIDNPAIIWEAGPDIEPDCLDSMCDCHVVPTMGLTFRLHFQPAEHYRRSA